MVPVGPPMAPNSVVSAAGDADAGLVGDDPAGAAQAQERDPGLGPRGEGRRPASDRM